MYSQMHMHIYTTLYTYTQKPACVYVYIPRSRSVVIYMHSQEHLTDRQVIYTLQFYDYAFQRFPITAPIMLKKCTVIYYVHTLLCVN